MENEWPIEIPVPKKVKLKLVGKDGNAFAILGRAKEASRKAKWTPEQWTAFRNIATSGDYDQLLRTHMTYFIVS
jgi:hypothetical protein